MTYVSPVILRLFSFVILRPEAEGSALSSPCVAQQDGGDGSFAALRMTGVGEGFGGARSGVWDRETGEGRGRPGDRTGVQL